MSDASVLMRLTFSELEILYIMRVFEIERKEAIERMTRCIEMLLMPEDAHHADLRWVCDTRSMRDNTPPEEADLWLITGHGLDAERATTPNIGHKMLELTTIKFLVETVKESHHTANNAG